METVSPLEYQTFLDNPLIVLSNFCIAGFRVLSGFYSLIVVVGCLYASNDDKRAWHDLWAGTSVFRKPRTIPKMSKS